MTDSGYTIDANQWPQILEDNWVRLRGQFQAERDSRRWIMQIEALIRKSVTSQEIMDGIQWALEHVPADSYFTPGPKDIVSWIRRVRHEKTDRRDEITENGRTYFRLTEKQRAEFAAEFKKCVTQLSRKKHVDEAESAGYKMLKNGDQIKPTDDYWTGETWVKYGDNATDENGKSIRLAKYHETEVRRKIQTSAKKRYRYGDDCENELVHGGRNDSSSTTRGREKND